MCRRYRSTVRCHVGAMNRENISNLAMCEILRKAILGRLQHNGIEIGVRNANSIVSGDIEPFSRSECSYGDGIKEDRIRTVRLQMKL